jgi:hypothetical protein
LWVRRLIALEASTPNSKLQTPNFKTSCVTETKSKTWAEQPHTGEPC